MSGSALPPVTLDLSVVILSWNVRDLLDACIRSVYGSLAESGLTYEMIVVDSASQDGSAEMVAAKYPEARLLALQENVGFSRGNNLGLAMSRGRYWLVLNPDTVVLGDALPHMVTEMEAQSDLGVLGPMLLKGDGTVQSSRRRFPTLTTALMESPVLQEWFPDSAALRRYYVRDRSDDIAQDVDWVYGACFLVRRAAAEPVGLLDESFFMYSEELDWMKRIKEAGWRVAYTPEARVIHYGGQSSSQVAVAQHVYFQSSKVHYLRKHYGWAVAEGLRWFILASYAMLGLIEGAKWLVGHKRPMRAGRIRTYGQVIASGLHKAGRAL